MKYCPNCRYEWEDHATVCDRCGAALVDELSSSRPARFQLRFQQAVAWPRDFVGNVAPQTFRDSWRWFCLALRSRYVVGLVVAVTLLDAAGTVVDGTARQMSLEKAFAASGGPSLDRDQSQRKNLQPEHTRKQVPFAQRVRLYNPLGFVQQPATSNGLLARALVLQPLVTRLVGDPFSAKAHELSKWQATLVQVIPLVYSLVLGVLNAMLLAPWLVWLQESLTRRPNTWRSWHAAVAIHGPKVYLWLLLPTVALLLVQLPYFLLWLSPVDHPLWEGLLSVLKACQSLMLVAIALTCLLPAVIVVHGATMVLCLVESLKLCRRHFSRLLALYGVFVVVNNLLRWVLGFGGCLPTLGYDSALQGRYSWVVVGPLQWVWALIFGTVCGNGLAFLLSAAFMGIVIEATSAAGNKESDPAKDTRMTKRPGEAIIRTGF